jgi:hypothetical protein
LLCCSASLRGQLWTGTPFTLISSIVVSSIGGTLAAVMLAVFIINEKNRHVYDLFLIRPINAKKS